MTLVFHLCEYFYVASRLPNKIIFYSKSCIHTSSRYELFDDGLQGGQKNGPPFLTNLPHSCLFPQVVFEIFDRTSQK